MVKEFAHPRVGQLYRHYKTGNLYTVVGFAHHCDTQEKMVLYYSFKYQKEYVRALSDWLSPAVVDGVEVPRFKWEAR